MTLRERYERLYSGVIYDALCFDLGHRRPFVVDHAIKPVWSMTSQRVLFGPAVTCKGERVRDAAHLDDTVRLRMFEAFTPGCVQVIDTDGDRSVAHFGDISGKLARRAGAVGAVIDGFTRDARILEDDRFPVFCRGTQPIDAFGRWQIVDYQVPIGLGGIEGRVPVNPGDYVFGDPDGVLVIPQDLAERVCTRAEERQTREDEVRRRLCASDDVFALYQEIGRW
jgi:4-hydroxy-4-methyl-2-oxoglutarate aldolase